MNQTMKEDSRTQLSVKPIPDGMHTVTPHLICAGAAEAIEFYQKAFGAVELTRMPGSDGKVMHASIRIGDSVIMLNDEMPEWGTFGPKYSQGLAGHHPSLRRECGRRLRPGGARGREGHDAARRHVLGRSLWQTGRPVRPSMVDRHPHAGMPLRRRCKKRWSKWATERARKRASDRTPRFFVTWEYVSVVVQSFPARCRGVARRTRWRRVCAGC